MEYKIEGTPLPVVTLNLKNGEQVVSESGAMSWMTPNIAMDTSSRGGLGKVMSRAFSGESLFLNVFTAQGDGMIAFASSMPGMIIPFDITPGKEMIVQKGGFLAATNGIELSISFRKKLGAGFFGGEGFIMQKLSGTGTAFVEVDGYCKVYDLQPGETIVVSTGFIAAMDATCTMDVKMVSGMKNIFFGGEGMFNTYVTGPGRVYIQTMPILELSKRIGVYITKKG